MVTTKRRCWPDELKKLDRWNSEWYSTSGSDCDLYKSFSSVRFLNQDQLKCHHTSSVTVSSFYCVFRNPCTELPETKSLK